MASSNRRNPDGPPIISGFASKADLASLGEHTQAVTNMVVNLGDRVALIEHALSNIINDVYYRDDEGEPAPESMMDDIRANTFEDEPEESVEQEAARLRAEKSAFDQARAFELAESDFANEGNPHGG